MEKGLFSGIVLLVIVVFLTPSIIFTDNSHILNNSYNHITLLSLSADNIVVDGLLDESFSSCAVSTKPNYDSAINSYLSSLLNETNKNNLSCTITLTSLLLGDRYSGDLFITCENLSKDITSTVSKTVYFDKEIDALDAIDPVSGNIVGCTTSIRDNLLSQEVVLQTRP